jgi:hypothetical protein
MFSHHFGFGPTPFDAALPAPAWALYGEGHVIAAALVRDEPNVEARITLDGQLLYQSRHCHMGVRSRGARCAARPVGSRRMARSQLIAATPFVFSSHLSDLHAGVSRLDLLLLLLRSRTPMDASASGRQTAPPSGFFLMRLKRV